MKICWVSPFSVVYDATPHYYQALFAAAADYLRRRFPEDEVVVEASGFHGATERTVIRHFVGPHPADYLMLWVRPWEASFGLELARTIRAIHSQVKILFWGDACNYIPHYFQRPEVDYVAVSGDPERVIGDLLQDVREGRPPQHGILYREGQKWRQSAPGLLLDPTEWPFPPEDVLDPTFYRMSRIQRGRESDDLSFMVSRGCPVNCAKWCPTPRKEGLKDRRRPVRATVEYMATQLGAFDKFQMHSPLFSWDRDWLEEFIMLKTQLAPSVPFKVVDLLNPYADEKLVARLAEVGLQNVGFGVETLSWKNRRSQFSKVDCDSLHQVSKHFRRFGVLAKAYVQIGLPGQTREDVLFTHSLLTDLGLRPRFTSSTPFWKLAQMTVEQLDQEDLRRWDRKSYYDPRCGLSYAEFYTLITSPKSFQLEEGAWAA
jgi:radical SAM superfamily enzyme YgiQ (UPF0313 family)